MTVDEALTTTRAVRKRLDLTAAGAPGRARSSACQLALQAPNGSNRQLWQWVVVDDADTRGTMADDLQRRARRLREAIHRSAPSTTRTRRTSA